MAKYTNDVRVRITPELRDAVLEAAEKINRKPSTAIRICLEAVLRPSEMTKVMVDVMRKGADSSADSRG